MEANLVEIFSSVQGEGLHVGATTLFIRLGGCDLRCRWCDSPHTWLPAGECRLEMERGTGRFRSVPNPLDLETVLRAVDELDGRAHQFASLTGGEPLLQADAVAAIAGELRARGLQVYLETHGLAVEALERVIDVVDVVSMDWKLVSDVRRASDPKGAPAAEFHDEHVRFLELARCATDVFVKLVVTTATRDDEIDEVCARIAACDRAVPLVLQPVTPFGPVREAPNARRMLALVARASRKLHDVRLIPQTHRIYGAP